MNGIQSSRRLHTLNCLTCVFLLTAISQIGCSLSPSGRNVDGVRNFQSGQYQRAIQQFQTALASDPNNANAYYNLGATYYALGKQQGNMHMMQQAEGLYHQCLDLAPNHTDCYRGLASLLVDTNRPDSAFTLLKRWGNRSQNLAAPRVELARLYEEFGDRENAVRHLTDALHLDSNSTRAWTALGRLREQQGQLAQALANYQQAYNLNQYQPGLAQRMASLQQGLSTGQRTGGTYAAPQTQMVNTPGVTTR
jgi:tetratricopeptide (TPR) repeat protein